MSQHRSSKLIDWFDFSFKRTLLSFNDSYESLKKRQNIIKIIKQLTLSSLLCMIFVAFSSLCFVFQHRKANFFVIFSSCLVVGSSSCLDCCFGLSPHHSTSFHGFDYCLHFFILFIPNLKSPIFPKVKQITIFIESTLHDVFVYKEGAATYFSALKKTCFFLVGVITKFLNSMKSKYFEIIEYLYDVH